MSNATCSAYVPGPSLCRNGFPQNGACFGATCYGCGRPSESVAACMRDEVPSRLIDEAGRPKFAIAAQKGNPS
jgi:hypothetical protein